MKFNGFCKQTNTGLWFGITEKPKHPERELREQLQLFKNDPLGFAATFAAYFQLYVLSVNFMREWVDLMDEYYRKKFEEDKIKCVLIGTKTMTDLKNKRDFYEKRDVEQNQIINCITYVMNGLVRYNKELNDVLR